MKQISYLQRTSKLTQKVASYSWAGPGKFFVVIFIGCLIVGIHENYFMTKKHMSRVERQNKHADIKTLTGNVFGQKASQSNNKTLL